jgi:hypothetical protein
MERVITKRAGPEPKSASVVLESVVTVPGEHLDALLRAFARAGIEAWDTGQRCTTEEGIDAHAEVRLRVPV